MFIVIEDTSIATYPIPYPNNITKDIKDIKNNTIVIKGSGRIAPKNNHHDSLNNTKTKIK